MKRPERISAEEVTLTKATIRACDRLGMLQRVLASVIGVSAPTVSRMRDGSFVLVKDRGKAFELAQLLVQLYGLLDCSVFGDELAARAWLTADNSMLGGRPIDLVKTVRGLAEVVAYLRARSSSL